MHRWGNKGFSCIKKVIKIMKAISFKMLIIKLSKLIQMISNTKSQWKNELHCFNCRKSKAILQRKSKIGVILISFFIYNTVIKKKKYVRYISVTRSRRPEVFLAKGVLKSAKCDFNKVENQFYWNYTSA